MSNADNTPIAPFNVDAARHWVTQNAETLPSDKWIAFFLETGLLAVHEELEELLDLLEEKQFDFSRVYYCHFKPGKPIVITQFFPNPRE